MEFVYLVVLALVFAAIWSGLLRRPRARIRIDPNRLVRTTPSEEEELPVEQPEIQDDITDVSNGMMPSTREKKTVIFRPDFEVGEELGADFEPDFEVGDELGPDDWSLLHDHDQLPAAYGEDIVTAIVRNPRSLYIYWELDGDGVDTLRQMLGNTEYRKTVPCLRVFDLTANTDFFIDVSDHDDHWFLHGLMPQHRYAVAFGRRRPDGRFYLIARSAPVMTPPESAAVPPEGSRLLYQRIAQAVGGGIPLPTSPGGR